MRRKQRGQQTCDSTTPDVNGTKTVNADRAEEKQTPRREPGRSHSPASPLERLSLLAFFALAARPQETPEARERLHAEKEAARIHAAELEAMNLKLLTVQAELEAQYRALELANEKLAALATTDGMTGLANHRAFQEELSRQISRAERSGTAPALLLMDVDRFKEYNDTFGHPAGDIVLTTLGKLLQEGVREGDYCARYGGEEFAVLLPDTDIAMAARVAQRLCRAVKTHAFPHREITVSIGVAQWGAAETATALIHRADTALYKAKSKGRDRVIALEPAAGIAGTETVERPDETEKTIREWEGVGESETKRAALPTSEEPFLVAQETETTVLLSDVAGRLLYGGLEGLLQEPSLRLLTELLAVLDKRGAEPRGHSERVTRYMMRLSRALSDLYDELRSRRPLLARLSPSDLTHFALGALLHDIGTIGIPDSILQKTEALTEEEWRQIRRHPLAGAELMAGNPLLARALPIVRYHHERWDGEGYPQGLAGEAIPLGARLFAVCDTFDSLTTDRPYRKALDFVEARDEIIRGAGTQFDPDAVQAFLRVEEEEWRRLMTPEAAPFEGFPGMPLPHAA